MVVSDSSARRYALDPDVRLMLEVRDGNAAAFEELVSRYQGRLLMILRHLVGSREQAEDLTQEVFLRVYRARESYEPGAKFCHLAVYHRQPRGGQRLAEPLAVSRGDDPTARQRPDGRPALGQDAASQQRPNARPATRQGRNPRDRAIGVGISRRAAADGRLAEQVRGDELRRDRHHHGTVAPGGQVVAIAGEGESARSVAALLSTTACVRRRNPIMNDDPPIPPHRSTSNWWPISTANWMPKAAAASKRCSAPTPRSAAACNRWSGRGICWTGWTLFRQPASLRRPPWKWWPSQPARTSGKAWPRPRRRRRRWRVLAGLTLLVAVAGGFFTVVRLAPDPNRQFLKDLPVLENLDEYRQIDDIEFLRMLRTAGLFVGHRKTPVEAAAPPAESLVQRQQRVEGMGPSEKAQLARLEERFLALDEEQQGQLRQLHKAIAGASDGEQLRQIMHRYYVWLKTLSLYTRTELGGLEPADRLEAVKKRLKEEHQRLGDEDSEALWKWMNQFVTLHEKQLLDRLSEPRRREVVKWTPQARQPVLLTLLDSGGRRPGAGGGKPPPWMTEADLANLRAR